MSGSSSVASGKSPVGKLPNDEGTVTGANELKRFKGVLTLPFKHKEVDPFLEPVDWQGLGLDNYPEVVTHPMDLNAVQARLEGAWTEEDERLEEAARASRPAGRLTASEPTTPAAPSEPPTSLETLAPAPTAAPALSATAVAAHPEAAAGGALNPPPVYTYGGAPLPRRGRYGGGSGSGYSGSGYGSGGYGGRTDAMSDTDSSGVRWGFFPKVVGFFPIRIFVHS